MKKGIEINMVSGTFDLSGVEIIPHGQIRKNSMDWINSPTGKGNLKATFDIANMNHYDGDITLPDQAFTNENDRLFFQALINRYRRHIAAHITDDQRAEAMREICRTNNEKRKIDLEPLIPEIERFIRQYRRDNPCANIEGTLEAVSQYLKDKHEINIETRTLRKYKIQEIIHRIKAEISAHTKKK